MKKSYLLLVAIFILNVANAQWVMKKITNPLFGVNFPSANIGYAVGTNIILKTTDGGITWNPQFNSSQYLIKFYDVCFVDIDTGYAVGINLSTGDGIIKRTTNGGINWTDVGFPAYNHNDPDHNTLNFYTCYFINSNIGYAGSDFNGLIKTTNGGATWTFQNESFMTNADWDVRYMSGYFFNADTGYFATTKGIIKTTDGGNTWTLPSSGGIGVYSSVNFVSTNVGYAATGDGKISKTTDNGNSWANQLSSNKELRSISFADADNGYVVGKSTIMNTSDGGVNWTTLMDTSIFPVQDTIITIINKVVHPDLYTVCAVGYVKIVVNNVTIGTYGIILNHSSNISVSEMNINNKISVYPNPATDHLTIENKLNKKQEFEIINYIGQTVYTSYIDKKTTVNISGLPNGVYFLKHYTDKETIVKKFIKQ